MAKYLYFFLFLSLLKSQQFPNWLMSSQDLDEKTIEDINVLRMNKIDFWKVNLSGLRSQLYFVPDSILLKYKRNSRLLSSEDRRFLNQFMRHHKSITHHHFILFSGDMDKYSNLEQKESPYTLTQKSTFYFQDIKVHIADKKRQFESHYNKAKFYLEYDLNRFRFGYGDYSIRHVNPLIYSQDYGRSFYSYHMHVRHGVPRAQFQASKTSASTLNGLTASYQFKSLDILYATGIHQYYSLIEDTMFSSFNSAQPISKKQDVVNEETQLFVIQLQSKEHSFQLSHLTLSFSHIYQNRDHYNPLKMKNTEYIGFNYRLIKPTTRLRINTAVQVEGQSSVDIEAQYKKKSIRGYINAFYYPVRFLNPKSKGLLLGQSRADNRYGYAVLLRYKLPFNIDFSLGHHMNERIHARNRNEYVRPEKRYFIETGWKIRNVDGHISYRQTDKGSFTNRINLYSFSPLNVSTIFRYADKRHAVQFQFKYQQSFIEFAYFDTDSHWQIYENGLKYQFTFTHLHTPTYRMILKQSFSYDYVKFGLKYRLLVQSKDSFIHEAYSINKSNRNTLHAFLEMNL